jgi:chemotaxis protein methyltransferase CheR
MTATSFITAQQRQTGGLVPGAEFELTARDFENIAGIMKAEAGISLHDNKANLVYSRLAKRLRILQIKSFGDYCALVVSPAGRDERGEMIAALTTNVTRFFREPHHFEHLKTSILPPLIAQAKKGGRIRIWSAACSSGQEPYSIALTILSLLPEAGRHDIKILATDIDPNMIAAGKAASYEPGAIAGVPAALCQRWFAPAKDAPGALRAGEDLRGLVTFKKLNLIGDWPMKGLFDAIFCRNVVIYFENDTQSKIWSRMVPLLSADGALYIGHSERVSGPAERDLTSDGITTYRRAASK